MGETGRGGIPFRLVFCENLALGVVADHLDIDEAAEVKPFCSEHRHCLQLQRSGLRLSGERTRVHQTME
jgi:hypothetical protein